MKERERKKLYFKVGEKGTSRNKELDTVREKREEERPHLKT